MSLLKKVLFLICIFLLYGIPTSIVRIMLSIGLNSKFIYIVGMLLMILYMKFIINNFKSVNIYPFEWQRYTVKDLIITLVTTILLFIILLIIMKCMVKNVKPESLNQSEETFNLFSQIHWSFYLIVACIYAPIVEELILRAGIINMFFKNKMDIHGTIIRNLVDYS